MSKSDEDKVAKRDKGIIIMLVDRFNKQRLPRAKSMQKKVNSGESLNDRDLALIRQVQKDSNQIERLLERHPEYKELATKVLQMWTEIIVKDIENHKTKK